MITIRCSLKNDIVQGGMSSSHVQSSATEQRIDDGTRQQKT